MRLGIFFPSVEHTPVDDMVERATEIAGRGFDSIWLPQSSSFDALTLLAVLGRDVPEIELGTSVVPSYPRHPITLGVQALTVNAIVSGRLALGIGLSHKMAIEGRYGLSYDRPVRHMREYLSVLLPLIRSGHTDFRGETLSGQVEVRIPDATPCPVYLAALQPHMLQLAGSAADGTITWCTGPITLKEQITPLIRAAAEKAGRPQPRILVALPCCVTDDEPYGRRKADAQLEGYGRIAVYRAVLDREGADSPGDVSIVGDEASVSAQLDRLAEIGATDFVAIPCGTADDRARTLSHLSRYRSGA